MLPETTISAGLRNPAGLTVPKENFSSIRRKAFFVSALSGKVLTSFRPVRISR